MRSWPYLQRSGRPRVTQTSPLSTPHRSVTSAGTHICLLTVTPHSPTSSTLGLRRGKILSTQLGNAERTPPVSTIHRYIDKRIHTVPVFLWSLQRYLYVCVLMCVSKCVVVQLVWATSSHVGCASQQCLRGGDLWEMFVCAYFPG